MNNEQMRIAIAEACGWTQCRMAIKGAGAPERRPSPHGYAPGKNYEAPLPDYPSCLNAMARAESTLDVNIESGESPRYKYSRILYSLVPVEQQPFRATAKQRAEAFLKTIGKWEE